MQAKGAKGRTYCVLVYLLAGHGLAITVCRSKGREESERKGARVMCRESKQRRREVAVEGRRREGKVISDQSRQLECGIKDAGCRLQTATPLCVRVCSFCFPTKKSVATASERRTREADAVLRRHTHSLTDSHARMQAAGVS